MKNILLYGKNCMSEEEAVYRLEYSLLIQTAEHKEVYGVSVCRTDEAGNQEKDEVTGLCSNREEAEQFLFRLAEGLAFPVELAALCDDYITEREMGMTAMLSA